MSRFVVKSTSVLPPSEDGQLQSIEPLEDTGLFVADAHDPQAVVEHSEQIAWAAPLLGDGPEEESYPTGELSIRFSSPLQAADLRSFVSRYGLEFVRQNEFVPEQVVVAPLHPHRAWLPTILDQLNLEAVVARAWPNTLARYQRD